ncbi:MAG: hypothetical protein H6812_04165 [Phycisphaeraceae bacterium]|nr:hypothetical protein [Phycisphaerales bacterium]MCB9842432.1 hypothetical protein [Phycisphaeraceae bacterium]
MDKPTDRPGQQTERPMWHLLLFWSRGWMTTDDRRRRVLLFVNAVPDSAAREQLHLSDREVASIRKELSGYRAMGAALTMVVGYYLSMIFTVLITELFDIGQWFVQIATVVIVAVILFALFVYRRSLSFSRPHLRRAMIARSRCACCGYLLTGINAEEDGCTVCPECASAWRLPEPKWGERSKGLAPFGRRGACRMSP